MFSVCIRTRKYATRIIDIYLKKNLIVHFPFAALEKIMKLTYIHSFLKPDNDDRFGRKTQHEYI